MQQTANKDSTLVINLSLSRIKIFIVSSTVTILYQDWRPIRTYINNSLVEQDPNEWWELLLELLSALSKHRSLSTSINTATVTSSALCLVGLNSKGNVVNKSIMVSDKRAQKEARDLQKQFPSFFKTHRGVKADASFMLPKILWLKRNQKNEFKKVSKFISSNDFLVYKLTGKLVTDYLNAEKFYYSHNTTSYMKSINTYCGISSHNLPSVVAPGTLIGSILSSVKKTLKVRQKIELAVSTYDAICALIGSSHYEDGELNNVCGTCSSYRIFSKNPELSRSDSLVVQNMPSENRVIVGGSNNLEGGVLEWAKECFYGDSFQKDDKFLYFLMQEEAKTSPLGARGILFVPYLLGERVPFLDPNVRGLFFGIERFHKRPDIVRSIFEAIGFQARMMLEEFEKNYMPITSVTMSGGVAKMHLATQIRSDVLGVPINIVSEVETTVIGASILTLKAKNKISDITKGKQFIKIEKTIMPNMHNHNAYSSLYILFKQVYTANKSLFKQRSKITKHIASYRSKVQEYL